MRWCKQWFKLCNHEWEYKDIIHYVISRGDNPYKTKEVYMCKKCLKVKRVRIL